MIGELIMSIKLKSDYVNTGGQKRHQLTKN